MKNFPFLLLMALFFIAAAMQPARADIVVGRVWMPASQGISLDKVRVYMTIENTGPAPDALTGAMTPVASAAFFASATVTQSALGLKTPLGFLGQTSTRSTVGPAHLLLPPGNILTMVPGSASIMLEGLRGGMHQGMSFPLTLYFASHPPITVFVNIVGQGMPIPAQ